MRFGIAPLSDVRPRCECFGGVDGLRLAFVLGGSFGGVLTHLFAAAA
jgi:hypothetical protein